MRQQKPKYLVKLIIAAVIIAIAFIASWDISAPVEEVEKPIANKFAK